MGDTTQVDVVTAEMAAMAETFRRMTDSCWARCVSDLSQPFLNAGEASCVDRCVKKFQEVCNVVSNKLQQGGFNNAS